MAEPPEKGNPASRKGVWFRSGRPDSGLRGSTHQLIPDAGVMVDSGVILGDSTGVTVGVGVGSSVGTGVSVIVGVVTGWYRLSPF